MEKEKKKRNKLTTKQFVLRCLGIVLICSAIIGATNQTFIGTFLTYSFAFLAGYLYPVILLILLIFGLRLTISCSSFKAKGHVLQWIGSLLLALSIVSICSFSLYHSYEGDPSITFSAAFWERMDAFASETFKPDDFSALSGLGGGFIGTALMFGLGNIWGSVGDVIFFVVVALLGVFLIIFKPIKNLVLKRRKEREDAQYHSPFQNAATASASNAKVTDAEETSKRTIDPSLVAPLADGEFGRIAQASFVSSDMGPESAFDSSQPVEETSTYPSGSAFVSSESSSTISSAETHVPIINSDTTKVTTTAENADVKPVQIRTDTYYQQSAFFDTTPAESTSATMKEKTSSAPVSDSDTSSASSASQAQTSSTSSVANDSSTNIHYNLTEEEKNTLLRRAQVFKDSTSSDDKTASSSTASASSSSSEAATSRRETIQENTSTEDEMSPSAFMAAEAQSSVGTETTTTSVNPLEAQAMKAKAANEKRSGIAEFKVDIPEPEPVVDSQADKIDQNSEAYLEQRYFEIQRRKKEEEQARIQAEKEAKKAAVYRYVSPTPRVYNYPLPDDSLFEEIDDSDKLIVNVDAAQEKAKIINNFFEDFHFQAKAVSYTIGASVTRFNIQMDPGVRSDKLASLVNDLQIALNGDKSVRIETVVEGRSTSGIEIGNAAPMMVSFKDVFTQVESDTRDSLLLPIGKDISGNIITYPLNDMPHLLVAGTTGSGKSVLVQSMILTLIMRNYPSQLKLILIDPKQVEFDQYKLEPHLFCPVVNDSSKAIIVLSKLCDEMDRRYSVLSKWHCVKIAEYQEKRVGREDQMEEMPNLVCVIDEFGDLMQTGGDEVASYVQRLTQKARAAGIYLIIATQRPSKEVIPMVIKANIVCRIGLSCSSGVDSRVILDENGAETLVGHGDLLFKCPGKKSLIRCQSPFVSKDDIQHVVDYLHENAGDPSYDPNFLDLEPEQEEGPTVGKAQSFEDLYEDIKDFVMKTGIVSKSNIMRNFSISYSKADQVIAKLRSEGIVEAIQGGKNIVVQRRPMEE